MKKLINQSLTLIILLFISHSGYSQFGGVCPEISSCNVGIGTSSPSARLSLYQDQTVLGLPGSTFPNHFDITRKIFNGMSTSDQSVFTIKPSGRIGVFNDNPSSLLHLNAPNIGYIPFEITKIFGTKSPQIIMDPFNYNTIQTGQSELISQKDASIIFTDNANADNGLASLVIAPRMSSNSGGIKIGNTGQLTVVNSELILDDSRLVINDGTTNQFQITSDGLLSARQVDVHLDVIPDYVFHAKYDAEKASYYAENQIYKSMTLAEVEDFIKTNRHLPGIKSESEYEEKGSINVGELQLKLLEKVEELTLHCIEQMKQIEELNQKQVLLEQKLKD